MRLKLFAAVFVAELAIFFAGASIPMDPSTQQATLDSAKELLNAARNPNPFGVFVFLFSHNTAIALGDAIPAIGAVPFFLSIYVAGQVVQAVSISYGIPGAIVGAVLFFFPYSLVELAGYAIALGAGLMLIVAWRKKHLRREVKVFAIEIVIVVLTLMLAAAMETATLVSPFLGFALWLPTLALIIVGAVRWSSGAR